MTEETKYPIAIPSQEAFTAMRNAGWSFASATGAITHWFKGSAHCVLVMNGEWGRPSMRVVATQYAPVDVLDGRLAAIDRIHIAQDAQRAKDEDDTPKPPEPQKVTIKMSDRPAIRIVDADWPMLAKTSLAVRHGGAIDHYSIRVRRHADGRHLVYGEVVGASETGTESASAGRLVVQVGDVLAAIRGIAGEISGGTVYDSLVSGVIANIPPEEIT